MTYDLTKCPGDAEARLDSFHMDLHLTLLWASLTAWVSVSPALSQ